MLILITVRNNPAGIDDTSLTSAGEPHTVTKGLKYVTGGRLFAGLSVEGRRMSPHGVTSLNDVRSPDANGVTE